jgi:hypothetical protein
MADPRNLSEEERTIKVEVSVVVDQDWIEFCTQYNELFSTNYCGYWLGGVEYSDKLGWLAWEHPDDKSAKDADDEPGYKKILAAWKKGKPLPPHWFRLDAAAAMKAWAEGCKKYGVDWYENSDAVSIDVVIQLALLGEVIYG